MGERFLGTPLLRPTLNLFPHLRSVTPLLFVPMLAYIFPLS